MALEDWTECQKKFSLYYITCCEHGGSFSDTVWNSCNYGTGDIFTLGAVQWAGPAAALFLLYIKDVSEEFYNELPTEWLELLDTYGWDNEFWRSYYNTYDNYLIWCEVTEKYPTELKQATLNMWFEGDTGETLQSYYQRMTDGTWAYINTDNIKIILYYMQIEHHRPAYLRETYQICGNTTNWELIANTIMAIIIREEGTTSNTEGFYNRYHTYAVKPLEEWDGESCPEGWEDWEDTGGTLDGPDDRTDVPNPGSGTSGSSGNGTSLGISNIKTNNQDLVIDYYDGTRVWCRQAQGNNVWIPYSTDHVSGVGSDSDTGSSSGGGDTPVTGGTVNDGSWEHCSDAHDLVQSVKGTWYYGTWGHYHDPYNWDQGGNVYNDCSGFVGWTVHEVDPELYTQYMSTGGIPYSTQEYQENGSFSDVIQCGYNGDTTFDVSLVKCFDIILINYAEASNVLKDYAHGGSSHIIFIYPDGDICRGYHVTGQDSTADGNNPRDIENVVTDVLPGCPYWEHRRLRYTVSTENTDTIPNLMIQYAYEIANDDTHGYSMDASRRWGTPDYDCASLVYTVADKAGLPVGTGSEDKDRYTGTMYEDFTKVGCTEVWPTDDMNVLQPGDILLNVVHHTALYVGEGRIISAHLDYDGVPGDGAGNEIDVSAYYAWANDGWGWDYVLRPPDYYEG